MLRLTRIWAVVVSVSNYYYYYYYYHYYYYYYYYYYKVTYCYLPGRLSPKLEFTNRKLTLN